LNSAAASASVVYLKTSTPWRQESSSLSALVDFAVTEIALAVAMATSPGVSTAGSCVGSLGESSCAARDQRHFKTLGFGLHQEFRAEIDEAAALHHQHEGTGAVVLDAEIGFTFVEPGHARIGAGRDAQPRIRVEFDFRTVGEFDGLARADFGRELARFGCGGFREIKRRARSGRHDNERRSEA